MRLIAFVVALGLAGCSSSEPLKPLTAFVSGPKFPASQFDCGGRPVPPDPAKATGKTAARYENALGSWGQGCSDKLVSTGSVLKDAGQVVGE